MSLKLRIGDAAAFRRPEDWSITPDDRQEKHQTIDGVVVEDYGHVDAGDVISCTVILAYRDYEKVYNYWVQRTKVTVIDHAGNTWEDMRVVIKKDSYVEYHESYHRLELEFWGA